MNQSGKWETWIWMKWGERERGRKKKNERDWNLQRVTSLLLVWLGGGIAGCGDGCELKSSKFIICKQISSTSLLISAITSLHRNLVPVTEKNIHHRPRWTSNSAKTGRLFSSYWHKLIKRYESRKNSKSFESRINAALTQARHVDTLVRLDDNPFRENGDARSWSNEYWFPSITTEEIILGYVNLHKEIYFFIGMAVNATTEQSHGCLAR